MEMLILQGLGESLPVLDFVGRAFVCVLVAAFVGGGAYASTCADDEAEYQGQRYQGHNLKFWTHVADFCYFFAIVGGVCAISEMSVHNALDPLWAARASGYLIFWGLVFTGTHALHDKKGTPCVVIGACWVVMAFILFTINQFSGSDALKNVDKTIKEETDYHFSKVWLATRVNEQGEEIRMSTDDGAIILYYRGEGEDDSLIPVVLPADKVVFKEDSGTWDPYYRENTVTETYTTYYNGESTVHKEEIDRTVTVWVRNFNQIPKDCRWAVNLGQVPGISTATG